MTRPKIGLQLYTVRAELEHDFAGVLREVAAIGYAGVEFAWNYGGMAPEALAAFLREIGLRVVGLYESPEHLLDPDSDAYAYAKALDCRYVTTGMESRVQTDWEEAIRTADRIGAVANSRGLIFTYHHHDQEFVRIGDDYAVDLLYARTDPRQVRCELDVYWILRGGEDPVQYLHRYAGRVPLVHLQDHSRIDTRPSAVGDGVLDVPGVYAAACEVGVDWLIVEQYDCVEPPREQIRRSMAYLRAEGMG